jgi:PAS domain S-box-containing protein
MPTSIPSFELFGLLLAAFGAGAGVVYLYVRRDRRALAAEVRSLWERLDAIFYRSPLAVSLCELDLDRGGLRILDCNEETCTLHGGPRDQLLAAGVRLPAANPEQAERIRAWFKTPRPSEAWHGEATLRRLNGVEVPIVYVWSKVEIGGREFVLALERDVSEQRKAELALKESEYRFRQLIETANCLLWKARLKEVDGTLVWKFDIPLSGLRQRLFTAANLTPDNSVLWSGFDLPELATMNERCTAALRRGERNYRQEFRLLLPHETMWLQEHVEIEPAGHREWNLVGVVVDITRLKETEEAMRLSEERNRLVLKASNDGIWDYDVVTGKMTTSDRCRSMLGLRGEEMPATADDWRQRMHEDDLATEAAAWKKAHATGEPCVYQARFRHEDGFWRWIMVRAVAVKNDAGELLRIVGSHTDITELKRNDSELQQGRRLRAIGELVGGIAHEFNNLLTPMLLQTTLMTDDGTPQSATLREHLKPVIGAIKEARELTQRILTFGRKSTAETEELDLGAAVHEHLELLRHTIDRRVSLSLVPAQEQLWVRQSRTDIAQIVINLVLNARDTLLDKVANTVDQNWTPTISIRFATLSSGAGRGGTVSGLPGDESSRPQTWHRLTVRDNGMGMTDEVRERIFEPFYTTKETGQGTGLGLATVWHLVRTMGGRIEVETRLGVGSAFHVSWPAIAAPVVVVPAGTNHESAAVSVSDKRARILLVEDQPEVVRSLTRILERWGHDVTIMRDGTTALQRIARGIGEFDVCLTDLNMPGATGFDVIRAIRAARLPLKIVVMGGYLTGPIRHELEEWRVDAIMPKPFSLEDIESALRACGF